MSRLPLLFAALTLAVGCEGASPAMEGGEAVSAEPEITYTGDLAVELGVDGPEAHVARPSFGHELTEFDPATLWSAVENPHTFEGQHTRFDGTVLARQGDWLLLTDGRQFLRVYTDGFNVTDQVLQRLVAVEGMLEQYQVDAETAASFHQASEHAPEPVEGGDALRFQASALVILG